MSLDLALNNAISGLNVSQEALSVLSNNIANANTAGYARRIANQVSVNFAGVGNGARIEDVVRQVDTFLMNEVRTRTTTVSAATTLDEYYTRIQNLFGPPDGANGLTAVADSFFNSLNDLAANPELSALRLNAVNNGIAVASKVSSFAQNLQDLRLAADQDIGRLIGVINQDLTKLHDLNTAIKVAGNANLSTADLEEQRDSVLNDLAQYLDISVFNNADGTTYVTTGDGISLVSENLHKLTYVPASSSDTFTNDSPLDSIRIQTISPKGTIVGTPSVLVQGGTSSQVSSKVKGGELYSLLEMRDTIIPQSLSQLDTFASTLRDAFNAIHNDGAGFPPPSSITGTTGVLASDERDFSGKVMIGVVDANGKPIPSGYDDGTSMRPLVLDLDSLDNGEGNGRPDMQTILDEINNYYGPPQQRISVGPLYDIKIASRTETLGAQSGFPTNSTFTFDFELDNAGSSPLTFSVLDIDVLNAGAAGLVGGLPGVSSLDAGTRARTGSSNSVTVDFNGATTPGPYTIRAMVKVEDADGNSYVSYIDYQVNDNTTDMYNDRFSVSNLASGDGTIVQPTTSQRALTASFVNAQGNPAGPNELGYLKLTTNPNAGDFRIAIDEMNSSDLGQPENASSVPATKRGFSHYFGLNNFFVDKQVGGTNGATQSETKNAALNLKVRQDIINDPNRISLGSLTQSSLAQPIEKTYTVGTVAATGRMAFAGNLAIGDTITINNTVFNIVAAAAGDNEITLGATLSDTLDNIVSKLNTDNAYTRGNVALASYSTDGTNLQINFDTKGTLGNAFLLAANTTTSGQLVTINTEAASVTATGSLVGGQSEAKVIQTTAAYTYELGSGSNEAVKRLGALGLINIGFKGAGGLPDGTFTLSRYATEIIDYNSTNAASASSNLKQQQVLLKGFSDRLETGSAVNIDEELANTILFQNSYTAAARIINTTKELYDILFDAV